MGVYTLLFILYFCVCLTTFTVKILKRLLGLWRTLGGRPCGQDSPRDLFLRASAVLPLIHTTNGASLTSAVGPRRRLIISFQLNGCGHLQTIHVLAQVRSSKCVTSVKFLHLPLPWSVVDVPRLPGKESGSVRSPTTVWVWDDFALCFAQFWA